MSKQKTLINNPSMQKLTLCIALCVFMALIAMVSARTSSKRKLDQIQDRIALLEEKLYIHKPIGANMFEEDGCPYKSANDHPRAKQCRPGYENEWKYGPCGPIYCKEINKYVPWEEEDVVAVKPAFIRKPIGANMFEEEAEGCPYKSASDSPYAKECRPGFENAWKFGPCGPVYCKEINKYVPWDEEEEDVVAVKPVFIRKPIGANMFDEAEAEGCPYKSANDHPRAKQCRPGYENEWKYGPCGPIYCKEINPYVPW